MGFCSKLEGGFPVDAVREGLDYALGGRVDLVYCDANTVRADLLEDEHFADVRIQIRSQGAVLFCTCHAFGSELGCKHLPRPHAIPGSSTNSERRMGARSSTPSFAGWRSWGKKGTRKASIFSQFTSFLAIVRSRLAERGVVHEYLDGKTRDREARVGSFQNDLRVKLFLVNLKAGGVGLNLTASLADLSREDLEVLFN